MDNLNIKLHELQKTLLKKLTTEKQMRFNDLLIEGLGSEHMNYHLKRLIDLDLVTKSTDRYELTDKGKDYSNLMDDEVEFVEKQPKTSVLLHAVRKAADGSVEHLLNKRLRHPYFGKIGRLTGKVRFGETLEQAAQRELYEETGLTAGKIELEAVYHKLRHREDGTYVQDSLFYRFFLTDFSGTLIEKTPFQENLWISSRDPNLDKYDFFEGVNMGERLKPEALSFMEDDGVAIGF